VVVTGPAGIVSSTEMLTISSYIPTPYFTHPPVNSVFSVGTADSLSFTAVSPLPMTCQWIKDGVILAGQTNSTLNFPSFGLTNCGSYRVVLANAGGITTSLPTLVTLASEPLLAPTVYLHAGTRGGQGTPVEADAKHGVVLALDRPQQGGFTSLVFELRDPAGKLAASVTGPAMTQNDATAADGTLSFAIPGGVLKDGAYTLAISGVAADGSHTEIERHTLDIHLRN